MRRVWNDVLKAVAERNRPTQALLLNATVQDFQDQTLVLSMPTSGLVRQFAQQRRLDFVKDALRSVFGEEWEVRCVEAGAAAAAPSRPAPPKPAPQRAEEPPQRRPSADWSSAKPAQQSAKPAQQKETPARPSAPQRPSGNGRRPSDDIPPPPEPPPDDEPPPEDYVPPRAAAPAPPPVEEEDEEAMLADSTPADESVASRPDPEDAAVELLANELGARKIDD
ncbi:hypothetical protein GCM10010470_60840 [Saccharopolyspora taberi]|uniref:DNA polymerase III subunit tau-like C-terminal domain-containing protein n=1 Tax=Saccharopolyspora taberi TaxID=60895 RepID=A0ABN3VMY8_9PSEU